MKKIKYFLVIFSLSLASCTTRFYEHKSCVAENKCETLSIRQKTCINSLLCPKKINVEGLVFVAEADYSKSPFHDLEGVLPPPYKCFSQRGEEIVEVLCSRKLIDE